MWTSEEERTLREDLIRKVIACANETDGTLSRAELGKFNYAGQEVRVIDSQGGIWNPKGPWGPGMEFVATLSINTTNSGKYEDQEMSGGLWRYDYQAGGSAGKNTKMRKVMEFQFPLLWFVQQENGRYIPYRVFIISDFPADGYCLIAPDRELASVASSESEIERRYAERIMKQRLHQPAFRAKVLAAYETKCAICRINHGRLLDAAHIIPDSDQSSTTSVTNGLSLCKIHHAAYDINIVGIDAEYKIHIRYDLMEEVDGPMLEHGFKGADKTELWIPRNVAAQPNPELLSRRFLDFQDQ
ncbi:MAG: HNH endonuclease [Actinomycetes bacterium]|jgi:putative restriction endonuclease